MKILRPLYRAFLWTLALSCRVTATVATWGARRIQRGPSARLWLASDLEIAAEAKRRGLFKRRKKKHAANVLQMIQKVEAPEVCDFGVNGEGMTADGAM